MLDERQLKKKVALRLLGSPFTVVPFMAGMTALTASWAFGWNEAMGVFAALTGILLAGGGFITRWMLRGEHIARKVANEETAQEQRTKQKALDDLDHRLATTDNDPRTETALRDLRALLKVFEEIDYGSSGLNASSTYEIQSMVSQLFDQCVYSLQQTERFWRTAQQLNTPEARIPILEQREALIGDVQASIKKLSDALVAVQTFGTGERSGAELRRIREELDLSLEVAKSVEKRMNSFIKEAGAINEDHAVGLNQQQKGPKQ